MLRLIASLFCHLVDVAYLSHRRLVLEESSIARRQISADLVVRNVLDVFDGRAQQLVLQQTRICEAIAC
jgi:hypothetical protein